MKRAHSNILPILAASIYLAGLFLVVLDRYLPGIFCIAVGLITGVLSIVKALRNVYRPSRRPEPAWRRIISSIKGAPGRTR